MRDPETFLHVPGTQGHGVDAAPVTAAPSQPSWGPMWELAQGDVACSSRTGGRMRPLASMDGCWGEPSCAQSVSGWGCSCTEPSSACLGTRPEKLQKALESQGGHVGQWVHVCRAHAGTCSTTVPLRSVPLRSVPVPIPPFSLPPDHCLRAGELPGQADGVHHRVPEPGRPRLRPGAQCHCHLWTVSDPSDSRDGVLGRWGGSPEEQLWAHCDVQGHFPAAWAESRARPVPDQSWGPQVPFEEGRVILGSREAAGATCTAKGTGGRVKHGGKVTITSATWTCL